MVSSSSSSSDLSASDFSSTSSDNEKRAKKIRKKRITRKTKISLELSVQNTMDINTNSNKSKRLPQYVAALSVCLGSVAAGTVLGWTGTITDDLKVGKFNDIKIDTDSLGWISSSATLGAMLVCFPIGFICDAIGRKWGCLTTILPFSIGWLLIIFSNGSLMICFGRFLTGLAGGAFCVAAPMYTSEIADKEIRGALGSYFQLLLTVGILISYIIGAVASIKVLSIVCAMFPLIFGLVFFFQPETPVYLLRKNNKLEALKSLQRLRGSNYDSEAELNEIQAQLDKDEGRGSFMKAIQTKAAIKAIVICSGLMIFQQLSGINAVIFFMSNIFDSAGGSISSKDATIGVGVIQVVATFISSLVVDKFGRKILLIGSAFFMAVFGTALGIYFTLKKNMDVSNISFLPIVSIVVFVTVFSLGFGPIPWLASAEIMPPGIKSTASSAAATLNWFLAFLVTRYFNNLTNSIGDDVTFYIFAAISLGGCFFVQFFVPETKGKTIEEVQDILNGIQPSITSSKGVDNPTFKS